MRRFLLFSFGLILPLAVFSQADKWYFGVNAGLDFSSGSPVAIDSGALSTNEGCSSISDSAGNLLFYTDGITVWDSTNSPMPNGTGLLAGSSSTQAALIVKDPVSISQYYIFTTDEIGGPNGCKYSVVDMSLNGGLGDVTTIKNVSLKDSVTEKLSAVTVNGTTWVAIHDWGSDEYYSYRLDQNGLDTVPVVSHAGLVHNTSMIQNTYGQLKFNPCGTMAASAINSQDTVDLLNFDAVTGMFSDFMSIPFPNHVYGVEFSPDGSKLYVSTYTAPTVRQFDLSSGIPATILTTSTGLTISPDVYGMQLGPDKKIYVVKSFNTFLDAIDSPDVAGPGCAYTDNAVDLDPGFVGHTSALTLPGFDQSYFAQKGSCISTGLEEQDRMSISLYPNPCTDYFIFESENDGELVLSDITGRIILLTNIFSGKNLIQMNYCRGLYFVTIVVDRSDSILRAGNGLEAQKSTHKIILE